MKYYLFFLVFFCFQDCTSCKLDNTVCERKYDFEIPFSISPAIDTFKIGDTIWIESIIQNFLIDGSTGEKINVENHNFKVKTGFSRIDTLGYDSSADNFVVINIKGKYLVKNLGPNLSIINIEYQKEEMRRSLKVGVIFKRKGIYQTSMTNIVADLEEGINLTETNCTQRINLAYSMNNGEENNYYLEQYDVNVIPSFDEFMKAGAYNFVVIE
jgi:hypothetical protein